MRKIYYTGCIAAFILSFIYLLKCIYKYLFDKTEIEKENYAQIGKSYNFFDMEYTENKNKYKSFFGDLLFLFIIFPIFSRVAVALKLFYIIKEIKFRFDLPKSIKEEIKKIKIKLKHTNISSKRGIYTLVGQLNKYYSGNFGKGKEIYLFGIVDMSRSTRINDLYIYDNTLYYKSVNKEWPSEESHEILEYKIEGDKIIARTIENHRKKYNFDNHSYNDIYFIKDGKVLENNIKIDWENDPQPIGLKGTLKNNIKEHQDNIKRHTIGGKRETYILYYNLSTKNFKKYAETKINELKYGGELRDKTYDEIDKKYKDTKTWEEKKELVNKKLKKYGIEYDDFYKYKTRIEFFENILKFGL